MSNSINPNQVKQFILKAVGSSMTQKEAQKLGVDKEYKAAAEELDVNELNLDDIINDKDLYEEFATMCVAGKDDKADAKDEDTKKKEENEVKGKNQAGV